jgi:NADH-quinone oxidoreductase subunit C
VTQEEIFNILKNKFNESIIEFKNDLAGDSFILIASKKTEDICLFLRDDQQLKFDYLSCLSGLDNGNGVLGVVYNLYSFKLKHKITLKTNVTRDNPHVQTVSTVWLTADWHEREAYDMIGIIFDGHKDLRRILCPYDWEGHPLRKDYEVQEFYNGMRVPY